MQTKEFGQIIILNGTPRSGKTSIAHVIQETYDGIWVNIGVDPFKKLVHPKRHSPGIGFRPTKEGFPELEQIIVKLYAGMYESIAAHSRLGINVVVDVGHHDSYSEPLGILKDSLQRIRDLPVFIVGVRCPVDEIMDRRRKTWPNTPSKDEAIPEEIFLWQEEIHKPGIYDIEIDTSKMNPEQCAIFIKQNLAESKSPFAIDKILYRNKCLPKTFRVPNTISEITLEWISKSIFQDESKCIPAEIEIDTNFGNWSLLGKLARVKLGYKECEGSPSSVIVKFQGQHAFKERERQIYNLLKEAKIDGIPHLYKSFEHGTLILQDITPAKSRSLTNNCTINEAKQILSTLSQVHGHFWEDPRIPQNPPEQFAAILEYNMRQCWDIFRNRYKNQLNGIENDFIWIWCNSYLVSSQHNSWPRTLCHCDLHSENILFYKDESRRPVLIDWQLSGSKVVPFDLSYFLVQSFTPSQRKENEMLLCREYFKNLPEKAQKEYSFDRFWLGYRACLTRSMMSAVMFPGPRFKDRPDQMKYSDILAERVIAAVKDLKPVDAIKELKSELY